MMLSQERNNRFSKDNRLSKARELYNCYNQGRKVKKDWLSLSLFIRSYGSSQPRLGILIKRKVFKKAIERNMFKRQIREWFRLNKKNIPPYADIVITAEQRPNSLKKQEIKEKIFVLMKSLV